MAGRRILVVDDDPQMRLLTARLLQKAGYVVMAAMDASQAMMQALRERPDLILLDLIMPAGGGLTVLDRLRASTRTSHIPIIVITGSDQAEMEAKALAGGAGRVLHKPCEAGLLLEAVASALGAGG